MIPCQESHFWRFPFLGILTIRPLEQSLGMFSSFQMIVKRAAGHSSSLTGKKSWRATCAVEGQAKLMIVETVDDRRLEDQ